jgi:hypothetical protein
VTSSSDEKRALDSLESRIREIQERVGKMRVIVALLGAGGKGLEERRTLASELRSLGFNAIIPEDVLPPEVSPSIAEAELMSWPELDLAFVNVQSWGSAVEFTQFHEDSRTAPKLRVIVASEHHPLYGSSRSGYLTDLYWTHDAVFGHVYMHGMEGSSIPSVREIVVRISERFRQWKALSSN